MLELVKGKWILKLLNGEIFSVVSPNFLRRTELDKSTAILISLTEAGAGAPPPTISPNGPEAVNPVIKRDTSR